MSEEDAPLTREQQIELMQTARQRLKEKIERWRHLYKGAYRTREKE